MKAGTLRRNLHIMVTERDACGSDRACYVLVVLVGCVVAEKQRRAMDPFPCCREVELEPVHHVYVLACAPVEEGVGFPLEDLPMPFVFSCCVCHAFRVFRALCA